MFSKLKLGLKFNLLLAMVFLVGIVLSGTALAAILNNNAQQQVTTKALILIQTMNSVRQYTSERINPLLSPQLDTAEQFIPETVPGYSAREVFENLREAGNREYAEFFYKEATLNPTNPRDRADEFEAAIVERFRREPQTKEITGFRDLARGQLYYIARPIAIKQESCLRCHSTPDAAPASMLATYGRDNGFGWKLNEIVGAQIISVPASEVVNAARQSLVLVMLAVSLVFGIAIVAIDRLLRHTVIRPIDRMVSVAQAISTGDMDAEFQQRSDDEIGTLAAAFNRMKLSLQMAMTMLSQQENQRG